MAIYLLVPTANNAERLGEAVKRNIRPADRYEIANRAGWFIRFDGTTVEASNAVGITGQEPGENTVVGSTVVTLVTSYYGRGATEMWEWLKTRMERGG